MSHLTELLKKYSYVKKKKWIKHKCLLITLACKSSFATLHKTASSWIFMLQNTEKRWKQKEDYFYSSWDLSERRQHEAKLESQKMKTRNIWLLGGSDLAWRPCKWSVSEAIQAMSPTPACSRAWANKTKKEDQMTPSLDYHWSLIHSGAIMPWYILLFHEDHFKQIKHIHWWDKKRAFIIPVQHNLFVTSMTQSRII